MRPEPAAAAERRNAPAIRILGRRWSRRRRVPAPRRVLELSAILFGWLTWALSGGYSWYLLAQVRPTPRAVAASMAGRALAGAAVTFVLFAVLRRLCARHARLGPRFGWAAALAWLAAYAHVFIVITVAYYVRGEHLWLLPPQNYFPDSLSSYVTFLPFAALFLLITIWWELRGERERVLRADSVAHDARLQMLRFQLNPHFLFNALGTIRGVLYEDPARADRLVSELTQFLRYTLVEEDRLEVTVGEELDVIQNYLNIQQTRFEAKLCSRVEADAAARAWVIPAFLLHPLVENAVKHGMRTSPLPLRVAVRATSAGGELCVEVSNSGSLRRPADAAVAAAAAPVPAAGADGEPAGMGLRNVRQQLQHHFPGRHDFVLEERGGQVQATLRIRPEHVHSS